MIFINIRRNKDGHIWSFSADNHGRNDVCAAVSLLVLNTVNSIEAYTDAAFTYDYNEDGGHIRFDMEGMKEVGSHHDAGLLLDAMSLGLRSVAEQYPDEVLIEEGK